MGPSAEVRRFNRLGLRHYHAGRYAEAVAMFEAARERNRETPEPAYYIGRCYLAISDQKFREDSLVTAIRTADRAEHEFRVAQEAFPGYTKAIRGRAEALKRKGRHEAALRLADWSISACGPRTKLLLLAAREYSQAGDLDRALATLNQAVEQDPGSAAAQAELGRFHARLNNREAALVHLRRAYDLDPQAPGVREMLEAIESSPYDVRLED